uniref:Signal recognition particle subunit SRP68 n=1 Tax=Solanum lycopersicum TaxID=4081 RepID=A0A3Q7EYW7_SOLLC
MGKQKSRIRVLFLLIRSVTLSSLSMVYENWNLQEVFYGPIRRLYKSLKFTHGRLKYTKRSISVTMVTEVSFLHLVLYTTERAWSHAMEKKTLLDRPNAHQRSYLIGQLRKAVKWASLFQELCSTKGDSRTSLEAEIMYSSAILVMRSGN